MIVRLYLAWMGEPEGASVNLQQESLVTISADSSLGAGWSTHGMGQPAPRVSRYQ